MDRPTVATMMMLHPQVAVAFELFDECPTLVIIHHERQGALFTKESCVFVVAMVSPRRPFHQAFILMQGGWRIGCMKNDCKPRQKENNECKWLKSSAPWLES
jgi:hypothetical protein